MVISGCQLGEDRDTDLVALDGFSMLGQAFQRADTLHLQSGVRSDVT